MLEAQQPAGESIRLRRGRLLFDQRRYEDALAELQAALAENPDSVQAHVLRALSLGHLERWREATQAAQAAVGLDPASPEPHYAIGIVYEWRNMLAEALDSASMAIACDPAFVPAHALTAQVLLRQKKYDRAIEAATTGLQLDPDNIECTNLLAAARRGRGEHAQARESVHEALRRDPDNTHTHANMGWQALHAGDHKAALQHFSESLRLDATNEWARSGIIEAVKARFFLYRLLLAYFLWVGRLRGRYQIALILGLVFGVNIVNGFGRANPELLPLTNAVVGLYRLFVLSVWIAFPLSNGVLSLSRFGRLALPAWDRWWGLLVLSMCGVGIAAVVPAVLSMEGWQDIAFACAFYVLFLGSASTMRTELQKPTAIVLSILLGLALAVNVFANLNELHPVANLTFALIAIVAVASTWFASGMALRRAAVKE